MKNLNLNKLKIIIILSILLVLMFLFSAKPIYSEVPLHRFYLNGKEIHPITYFSLNGTPEYLQEGDVIKIDQFLITIGKPGKYKFEIDPYNQNVLYLSYGKGKRKIIAVKVENKLDEEKYEKGKIEYLTINHLFDMTNKEIFELWGIGLYCSQTDITERLKYINPKRVCIAANPNSLPLLPRSIEYLIVNSIVDIHIHYVKCNNLQEFTSLRFLIMPISLCNDIRLLKKMNNLRYLATSNIHDKNNLEGLEQLNQLRCLKIINSPGVTDLSFAKTMPNLKYLNIAGSDIKSISTLEGSESIEFINANNSTLRDIQVIKLQKLKMLKVINTNVCNEQISAFQKTNPSCIIFSQYESSLKKTLKDISCVRLVVGEINDRIIDNKIIYEERNPVKIKDIIDNIQIDEKEKIVNLYLPSRWRFEFYSENKVLAILSLHQGQFFRWLGSEKNWPGDALLKPESGYYFSNLFYIHGVNEPLEEYKQFMINKIVGITQP
jgi:hypothetical protein